MHKKFLFASILAVAGFVTLTAFGAKTLAEQKAEIDLAVKSKLEELRAEKIAECDGRAKEEAKRRFAEEQGATPATEPVAPTATKKPIKKGNSKGPKVDPLPQPAKPTDPAQAKKDKTAGAPQINTEEKKAKTAGEPAAPVQNTNAKRSKTAGNAGGN